MPKNRAVNERIRREKREAIMGSAMEVFAKKGYAATNIEDIAQNARISVGLIYRYFPSKEALYSEIVDVAIGGLTEVASMVESSQDPMEGMESIAAMMLGELDNQEFINLNLMMMQSTIIAGSPRYDEILECDKKMFLATANLIRKGQEQGVFAPGDAMRKSVYFFSSIMGTVITRGIYKDEFPAPLAEDAIAFLLNNQGDEV